MSCAHDYLCSLVRGRPDPGAGPCHPLARQLCSPVITPPRHGLRSPAKQVKVAKMAGPQTLSEQETERRWRLAHQGGQRFRSEAQGQAQRGTLALVQGLTDSRV